MPWVHTPEFSLRYACTNDGCKARMQWAQMLLYKFYQPRFLAHELAFEETRIIRMRHHEVEIVVDVAHELLTRRAWPVQRGGRLLAKLPEEHSHREAVQFFLGGKA